MTYSLKLRLHRGPSNFTVEVQHIENVEGKTENTEITLKQTIIELYHGKFIIGINYAGELYDIMGNPVEIIRFSSNEERDKFRDNLINDITQIFSNVTGLSTQEITDKYFKHSIYYSNLLYEWVIGELRSH